MNEESSKFAEGAALVGRLVLGGFFIYMGFVKAMDPVGFLKLVRQYEVFHTPLLLNSVAATLPWFECFCGLLLVLGVAVRGTALVLAGILIPFTAVVWHRALELQDLKHIAFCAVKFDCGCGNGEEFICGKLVENIVLILIALFLVWSNGKGRTFALRYSLSRQT